MKNSRKGFQTFSVSEVFQFVIKKDLRNFVQIYKMM